MIITDVIQFGGYVVGSYFIGFTMSYLPYLFRRLGMTAT